MKAGSWKALVIVGLLCLATSVVSAQTLTTLVDFNGSDGKGPFGMIHASNGNFYGTTFYSGTGQYCSYTTGCGTIFEMTAAGKVTTLYSFCSQRGCTDGAGPNALFQASNGNFYGTTEQRGAHYQGTIFEMTPAGKVTTLYSFCAQSGCPDGSGPVGALVQGANGNLYGETINGGSSNHCVRGCGTVFKITLSGKFTSLFTFCVTGTCVQEGRNPVNGLTVAPNGN